MKKLLLFACLFCASAFAYTPEELAKQAKLIVELRECPNDPEQKFVVYVFNAEGFSIVINAKTIQDPLNVEFLGLVLSDKKIPHEVFYVGDCVKS